MQTVSASDFEKMYGTKGVESFGQSTSQPQKTSATSDIKSAFKGGIDQFKSGVSQAKSATNPIQKLEAGLQEGAGLVGAAFSPLAPATKYINQGINKVAEPLSKTPLIKQAAGNQVANSDGSTSYIPNESANRVPQDISNTSLLLSLRDLGVGGEGVSAVSKAAAKGASQSAADIAGIGSKVGGMAGSVGRAAKDIVPTAQGIINHQVTKALDLSTNDLNKISRSTGNDIGTWLADNNLIGENKVHTQENIKNFTDQNFNNVRSHVNAVDTVYKQSQVPRYVDALKAIGKKIDGVPGLEKQAAEVENLLNKKEIKLNDVQHVKELLDSHFNLYKVTGDVAEGAAKEGLANIRSDLRSFIEKQVKDNSGADIHQMNNHVATGKTLQDAIKTRAPKGITQANLKLGDLGIFGVGMSFGGPLGGAALLFGKKLLETPTVRLRIAKYLDEVSDAKKAKIQAELQSGKIPPEFNQFIKGRH